MEFLFLFLPLFLFVYYPLSIRAKDGVLLLGSLVFYGFGVNWNICHIGLLIASFTLNFWAARGIERIRRNAQIRNGEEIAVKKSAGEKAVLLLGLCCNFGTLLFFKYAGFFMQGVALPLGISFYTFQATSYLIDVYRCKTNAEKDIVHMGVYLAMFPKLTAGPIAAYGEMKKQLEKRKITLASCNYGLQIFTLGLGFKTLLANHLGKFWEDVQAIGYESISTPLAWLGILAYSLQIYFDFYGYSLMAAGLGRLLGFRIPDNFRQPYMALSMTEFWRKWHITLGRWFREYVYIPLGGSQKGKARQFFNLLVVWLLTGLWHGANWNFILWGLLLFVILCIEKAGLIKILERWKLAGHLYMCFWIPVCWAFFAITDLGQLKVYLLKLFPFLAGSAENAAVVFQGDFAKYIGIYGIGIAAGLLCCTGMPEKLFLKWRNRLLMSILLLLIFGASVYCIYQGLNDSFLYNRF